MFVKIRVFRQEPDVIPAVDARTIAAEDGGRAAGGFEQTQQHLHGRGFARPIGANQAVDLTRGHLEREVGHGRDKMFSHRRGAKHFGEVFDADRWGGVGHVRRYGSTGAPIARGKFRRVVQ